jgi:hypothetical protein
VDKLTLEHQVFLYESYIKCNSTRKSQWKFRRKLPRVQVPIRNTIHNLVNKVRIADAGNQDIYRVVTEEKLDKIRAELKQLPCLLNALRKK